MFSGIHSLIFGKKHHKHKEDPTDDKSQPSVDNEFVVLERRHSDEFDRNSALYPDLDPSQPQSNLPYVISPSLPNLKDATSDIKNGKDEMKVDMLQGVPFVLSSQVLLLDGDTDKTFSRLIKNLNTLKESSEESLFEDFTYDFELEHTVSSEFASYDD